MASRAGRDQEAYAQAAAILARAGAQVEEVPQPPAGDCMLVQLHADIMAYEASQSLAYERLEHAAQLSAKIQSVLEAGARITAEEHQRNLARAAEVRARVDLWFDRYDVLLTPAPARRPSPTWVRAIRSSRAAGRCSACPA